MTELQRLVLSAGDATLAERMRQIRLVAFDFDGVFTDNMVYVFEDGAEAVRCSRGDGIGLRKLEKLGIEAVIVSSEPNPVVLARSRKLQIRCIHDCKDKAAAMDELARGMGISLAQTAFVGNDVNDLPALAVVGLPIVVHDAHPDVQSIAYQTLRPGGYGAVREVCDLFAQVLALTATI